MTRRWFVLVLTGALAPIPALFAHEGHGHKVMGTVSMIHESHLEVKDKAGKITTHQLDVKTKVRRGKTMLRAADIKVGDRVVVTVVESKDKGGKLVKAVTQVDIGAAPAPTATKR